MTEDNLLDDSFPDKVTVDNDVSFFLDNSTEINYLDEETVKSHSTSSSSVPPTTVSSLSPASDNNDVNAQETMMTSEITDSVFTTLNPGTIIPNSPSIQTTTSIISSPSQSYGKESSEVPVMTETVSEVPEMQSTTFGSTSTTTRFSPSTRKRRLPLRKDFAIALLKIVSRVNRPTVPFYVTTVTSNLNEESTVPYSPPVTSAAEMISELSQQDVTTFSPYVTSLAKKITTRAVTYSPKVVSSATVGTTPHNSTAKLKATSINLVTEKMPEVFTTSDLFKSTSTFAPLSSPLLSLSSDAINSTTATPTATVAVPITETTLSETVTVVSSTETLTSTVSEIKPSTSTEAVNNLATNKSVAAFTENIIDEIQTSYSNKIVHTSNSSSQEAMKIRNSKIRFVSVDRPPLESDNLVTESSPDLSSSVKESVVTEQSTATYSNTEKVSASSTVQIPASSSTTSDSEFASVEMLKMINTSTMAVSVDRALPNNDTLDANQPISLVPSASPNTSSISLPVTEASKLVIDSVTQSVPSSTETDSLVRTRFPVRITIAPRGTASTTTIPPLVKGKSNSDPVAQRRIVDNVNDETQHLATTSHYQTTTTVRTPLPYVIFGIFPNNTVFRKYPHSGKTEQVSENEIARHQEYYPEEQTSQTSYTTSVTGDPIGNEILYRNAMRNSVQTSLPRATVNTRLPAGRNPSENEVAWALGTRTSIPIPPAQSEIDSGQQTEMISDSKTFITGPESIVVSASDRSVIPTVTQRVQPQVTFALPSEVSNSVYNVQGSKYSNYWSSSTSEKPKFHYITSNSLFAEISTSTSIPLFIVTPEPATSSTTKIVYKWKPVTEKQNLVEKTTDNGISSTKTEKLNIATQLPIQTNAQTVPSSTVSSTEATLPLSSSTMTISQITDNILRGVPKLETAATILSGISNPQEMTTPVISASESTSKLSTVERIGSTLLSSVPMMKERVTTSARVTTERFLSQPATSPSPPLSIRGLISRVLGNITPNLSTASTIGKSTVSPVMTVTAKRQLTTMTSLPVSSYITERLVTVTPVAPLTNNSSSKPIDISSASVETKTVAPTTKPATSRPTTAKAAPATVTTIKTTTKATTMKPAIMTIATSLMTTTLKPTSQKSSTSKPSTPKPTTPKPTTAKATTPKPTTPKPTTPKLTTSKPTTPKPTTPKSTTPKPTTPKPTTPKPTTPKPTTPKPTTAKLTTSKPPTAKPTTSKPTTPKPTTSKPTTPKPTTSKPMTPKPTTSKPAAPKLTTSKTAAPKPTTPKPTTPKPMTPKPTTAKPMTSKPTTPKPTNSRPTTPKATTSQLAAPNPSTSKPTEKITRPLEKTISTVAQTTSDSTSATYTPPPVTSPRNSLAYSSLNTVESGIKHVESESVHERNNWQTLDRQGRLEELSLLNILAQNVGGRQEQKKVNLADKVIEAALQRSSTTSLPLFNNNLPKTKVLQTLENGVESNRFSLDLLGQQSVNINADDVTDEPTVSSSVVELEIPKNTPVVSSKSPTVETVTSGKLSPQDEQLLLALFGNQISGALQQPKSQSTRSRSRLSPEEQLLASLLRQQASADLKTSSKGGQQQKEQVPEGHSLSTPSTRPKSQGLPVPGKLSEEELLLSLLGGQPKTTQKATERVNSTRTKLSDEEILAALLSGQSKGSTRTVATTQVNSTRTKLSDEEILAALLSGQSKGSTRTVATTQRTSTKSRRLLTDEQIIAGLLSGSTPASPADQARLAELLNGGRHRTRATTTTTPAVPRGLGILLARPGSQGLFSSALQPDAGSIDPGADLSGGEDGIRGPREQGTLVKAAIDVTKAVSQFMSAVIQGATRSFQSFFRSGTNLLSQYFSLGSAQAGNFQLR
ncbi:mucin-17-like isoform X1 [Schistocerca americana]|uniref:mucin-17-like isoform X1 n=1 Tax=Schistocerca americana TaxID=7009 RepID=UPI001F4FA004|nr:mucin-17-like isoform X1 [Schistocerca americana]